jgi:hypothetical protein
MRGRTFSPATEFFVDLAEKFCQELATLIMPEKSLETGPHASPPSCSGSAPIWIGSAPSWFGYGPNWPGSIPSWFGSAKLFWLLVATLITRGGHPIIFLISDNQ